MIYLILLLLVIAGFLLLSLRFCIGCNRYHLFWRVKEDLCVKCKAALILLCLADPSLKYQNLVVLLRKDAQNEKTSTKKTCNH